MERSGARGKGQSKIALEKEHWKAWTQLTLFVTPFFLCINILNWGRVEEKIKHVSQRTH